jgi:hypothetical protein
LSPHTQTQQKQVKTPPSQNETGEFDLSKQLQRCSRPLSNNQTTTEQTGQPPGIHQERLISQGPTACHPVSPARPPTGNQPRSTPTQQAGQAVLDAGHHGGRFSTSTIPLVSTPVPPGRMPDARPAINGRVCAP